MGINEKVRDRMEMQAVNEINEVIVDCKRDPEIEVWEREIVRDFGSRLQVALVEMESDFAKHKGANPTVREYFIDALAQLQAIPSLIPRGLALGKHAIEFLLRAWTIGLKFIDAFIKKNKEALSIDSWSIGASTGFPSGVAATFSVSFKS